MSHVLAGISRPKSHSSSTRCAVYAEATAIAMNGELRSSSSKDGGRSPTSSADQEALVDVPLSFELSGFEPLPNANRGTILALLSLVCACFAAFATFTFEQTLTGYRW